MNKTNEQLIKTIGLSLASTIGIIGGCVLTAKATTDAIEKHEDIEIDKKEVLKTQWKEFILPTAVCLGTVACVVGGNVLNQRAQANLIGTYATIERAYKKYVNTNKEINGVDAHERVVSAMAENSRTRCEHDIIDLDVDIDEQETRLYYDPFVDMYITCTPINFVNAVYHLNRNLQLRGYIEIMDFYNFLGCTNDVKDMDIKGLGWDFCNNLEGLNWLDIGFGISYIDDGTDEGLECRIINYTIHPCII